MPAGTKHRPPVSDAYGQFDNPWAERVYRLLAEGNVDEAMQEFHDRWPRLRPPYDEKRLVSNIRAGNAKRKEHAS